MLKIINRYKPKDIFNIEENGLFYNLKPIKTQTYKDDSCHGITKSKQRVTVLLGCNADGTQKLPPLKTGKYNKPNCFRNVKNSPPNTKKIPIHGRLQPLLRSFLSKWITR
jgi:hypothetical protein